jgi:hypothetical protein
MGQQTNARVRSVPGFSRLSCQDAMPVCSACRFMREPRLPHRTWTAGTKWSCWKGPNAARMRIRMARNASSSATNFEPIVCSWPQHRPVACLRMHDRNPLKTAFTNFPAAPTGPESLFPGTTPMSLAISTSADIGWSPARQRRRGRTGPPTTPSWTCVPRRGGS